MFGVRPPGVKDTWEECDLDAQSNMIAYKQIVSAENAQHMDSTLR